MSPHVYLLSDLLILMPGMRDVSIPELQTVTRERKLTSSGDRTELTRFGWLCKLYHGWLSSSSSLYCNMIAGASGSLLGSVGC